MFVTKLSAIQILFMPAVCLCLIFVCVHVEENIVMFSCIANSAAFKLKFVKKCLNVKSE